MLCGMPGLCALARTELFVADGEGEEGDVIKPALVVVEQLQSSRQ